MPVDWSNTAAQNYYVLNRRGIITQLSGVMSQESIDVVFYTGETYRDELDAGFIGAARTLLFEKSGTDSTYVANGQQDTGPSPVSGLLTYATTSDPHLEQSDSFTHTEPRPLQVTRTRLIWWSGAAASGNVVGHGWVDEVVEFSSNEFDRI